MAGLLYPVDEIESLKKQVSDKTDIIDTISGLFIKYPDLMLYKPYPNTDYYIPCSRTVNKIVDDVGIFETQMFPDEPISESNMVAINIWPFMRSGADKIYSDPPYFTVGHINVDGFGIVPVQWWEDHLEEEEISSDVVRKVRTYLKSKPPINYK